MKLGIGTALCLVALISPAIADPASEAYVKDQIQALDADEDWSAAAASVATEGADTVVKGLTIGATAPQASLTVGEVRAENLVPAKSGDVSLTGGAIRDLKLVAPALALVVPGTKPGAPPETLTIGSIDTGGLEPLDPSGFTALGKVDPDADASVRDAAMKQALESLPKFHHFAIGDMTLGNQKPLTMKTLSVDVEDYLGPIPLPWEAEMTDLSLPGLYIRSALKHVDPRVAQILTILDDMVFKVDAKGGEAWADQAAGEVRATAHATINDGADIDLTYDYVGVSEDWLASVSGEALLGDLGHAIKGFEGGVKLKSLTLRVNDRTVLNDIFGSVAGQLKLGIDGATYRRQISSLALPLFMLALGQPQLLEAFLQPLQQFLGEGKTLVVTITPPEPISAAELAKAARGGDPAKLLALLNLKMTAE